MKCLLKCSDKKRMYAVGVIFFIIVAVVGVCLGSASVSVCDGLSEAEKYILLYIRLPRVAASLTTGAALSVAGAVIQSVLANRLASPSIIGVNAGAGLGVTICTALGFYGGMITSSFAFIGAFMAVMVVSMASKKWGASRGTVILIGVAFNSLLNAVRDGIVTFIPEVGVMSNDFKIGEFTAITYKKLIPSVILIVIALVLLFTLSNELDVLTLGEEQARSLGLNTMAMRVLFLMLVALLSGCAVSMAGLLSFVGLIVPHIMRRFIGSGAKHLLPACVLYGGAFVSLCDTASRTLFSPYEIPVGIIMAFLGAPFFIFILVRGKGGHSNA